MKERAIIQRDINRRCMWISKNLQYVNCDHKAAVEKKMNNELVRMMEMLEKQSFLKKDEVLTELEFTKQRLESIADEIQDNIRLERNGSTCVRIGNQKQRIAHVCV